MRASLPTLNLKNLESTPTHKMESGSPYKIKKGTFTIFTERSKLDRELILLQKYGPEHDKIFNPGSQREMFNKIMKKFHADKSDTQKSNISMIKKLQVFIAIKI